MVYTVCNKSGELSEKQISDADPLFVSATATAFRDKNQNPIMAVTFDGQVFFAVATLGAAPAAPVGANSDTPVEIHVPADTEKAEEQDEELSSD